MGSGSNPCCAIRTETSIAALIAEAYSSSITAAQIETANFQISSYTECLTAMGAIIQLISGILAWTKGSLRTSV